MFSLRQIVNCNNCHITVFAWEAYERGSEVHLQADPTKLELLHRSFKVKKEDFKEEQRESILEKVQRRHTFIQQQDDVASATSLQPEVKQQTQFCHLQVKNSYKINRDG